MNVAIAGRADKELQVQPLSRWLTFTTVAIAGRADKELQGYFAVSLGQFTALSVAIAGRADKELQAQQNWI